MSLLAARIWLACLCEAAVEKPGNVTPTRSFADLRFEDFAAAAAVSAPHLAAATPASLGESICDAVQATREATGTNVNLGMILLLAPLAAAAGEDGLLSVEAVEAVLAATTFADAEAAYAAIRIAAPGGLGQASRGDVRNRPTGSLTAMMRLAADRDQIARQYDLDRPFAAVRRLADEVADRTSAVSLPEAIAFAAVGSMARDGDTHVARRCGAAADRELRRRAAAALADQDLESFDLWLRSDGHRYNPGSTADLIAASLLWMQCDRSIEPARRHGITEAMLLHVQSTGVAIPTDHRVALRHFAESASTASPSPAEPSLRRVGER